ncbi:MAG: hypothetical protein LBM98_12460 [Oscillospiraceae bacterium]|nr:hypothetical protein [Oscillospiraceae bacterium]
MRYVPVRPARQSSAAVRRYVCFPPGTGLLRTCNALRIAGVAVLRNDELFSFCALSIASYSAMAFCSATYFLSQLFLYFYFYRIIIYAATFTRNYTRQGIAARIELS